MTCKTVQRRLSAFLDGELTEELTRQVGEHVSRCTECAAELARLQKVWQLLGSLPPVQAPPFFATRVLAQVKAGRRNLVERVGELVFARPLLPIAVSVGILAGVLLGSRLGSWITGGYRHGSEALVTQVATEFESFGDLPPGSLSEAYVTLASANNIK
ncbi:MAG: zf-HC2 domain-containing protein [bacterium]|jgi:anti-sigma factor RsiW|nr:zf-HC2 domain-containing protein [candidate division KSB1 bacterium]MDH7558818.1 zf-HC2 domain-containing protein [bacterium]